MLLRRPVDPEDVRRLSKVVDHECLDEETRLAFESMVRQLEAGNGLSDKQRIWVQSKYTQFDLDAEEGSKNLYSRGLVPRGKEVSTPEVLRKLPLKPPTKKVT